MSDGSGVSAAFVPEPVNGSEGLRIVLNYIQTVGLCKLHDGGHVAALTEKMDGYNGSGPGCQGLFYETYVRIESIAVHIHHHRNKPEQGNDLSRCHIGECRDNDLIPRSQAEGHERYLEGIRTVAAGNDISGSRILCKSRGETSDRRTVDKSRTVDDLRYGSINFRLDFMY